MNPEDDAALTEIGHQPRNFSRALKNITEEEVVGFKCRVADKKALKASGIKGLQIKVIIDITLATKRSKMLSRQLKKIPDCCFVL